MTWNIDLLAMVCLLLIWAAGFLIALAIVSRGRDGDDNG